MPAVHVDPEDALGGRRVSGREVRVERIVATAVNVIWLGFERVRRGEVWAPAP